MKRYRLLANPAKRVARRLWELGEGDVCDCDTIRELHRIAVEKGEPIQFVREEPEYTRPDNSVVPAHLIVYDMETTAASLEMGLEMRPPAED